MRKLVACLSLLAVILSSTCVPAGLCAAACETPLPTFPPEFTFYDVKLNEVYEIPDYAEVTLTDFTFADWMGYYQSGSSGTIESGTEQDYTLLYVSILNTTLKDVDFKNNEITNVTFLYADKYQFEGFVRQCDHNNRNPAYGLTDGDDREFVISPLYSGYYVIGAVLPNAVVVGDKQLEVSFWLGDCSFTYFIRK